MSKVFLFSLRFLFTLIIFFVSQNNLVFAQTPQECDLNNPQCAAGYTCKKTQFNPKTYCIADIIQTTCDPNNPQCPTGTTCQVGQFQAIGVCKPPTNSGPNTTAGGIPCDNGTGIQTAIGCINSEPTALVRSILKFAVGIGGGIAFLLMIIGAFQMITSAGSAEALKAGQERFYSAIIGLLFVIFSILLLKIIGVDILGFGSYFGLP